MKLNLSHARSAAGGALLLVGACLPWAGFAAPGAGGAWRCGNAYSDQPCTGAKAIDLDDARNADQVRAARESTRDAQAAADRMEKERLRLEAQQPRRPTLLVESGQEAPRKRPSPEAAQRPKKGKKDVVYVSAETGEAAPKKKSKKAAAKKSGD